MAYVKVFVLPKNRLRVIRKPLLYPSELRGHKDLRIDGYDSGYELATTWQFLEPDVLLATDNRPTEEGRVLSRTSAHLGSRGESSLFLQVQLSRTDLFRKFSRGATSLLRLELALEQNQHHRLVKLEIADQLSHHDLRRFAATRA